MAIKTQSGKSKGRKLQQYVRDKIIALLKPYGVVAEDCKSTSIGAGGVDVQLSPFAKSLLPIAVEAKNHNRMAIYKLWEQAEANKGDGEPVLVVKANYKRPLAVIDLDYYMKLERARIENENTT